MQQQQLQNLSHSIFRYPIILYYYYSDIRSSFSRKDILYSPYHHHICIAIHTQNSTKTNKNEKKRIA